jgi:hypothetical protein
LNYPPLTLDNIQFRFDEYGLLHIKFVNLKLTITGKHNYAFMFFRGDAPFIVKLNDFNWEQVFVVAKKELDNGKLDIKFKPSEESKFSYNIIVYNSKTINFGTMKINFTDKIKNGIINLDFTPFKTQLKK